MLTNSQEVALHFADVQRRFEETHRVPLRIYQRDIGAVIHHIFVTATGHLGEGDIQRRGKTVDLEKLNTLKEE